MQGEGRRGVLVLCSKRGGWATEWGAGHAVADWRWWWEATTKGGRAGFAAVGGSGRRGWSSEHARMRACMYGCRKSMRSAVEGVRTRHGVKLGLAGSAARSSSAIMAGMPPTPTAGRPRQADPVQKGCRRGRAGGGVVVWWTGGGWATRTAPAFFACQKPAGVCGVGPWERERMMQSALCTN